MTRKAEPTASHERSEREISIFRNGRSQAVRIPKEFEFATEKVVISRQPDGSLNLRPKTAQMSLVEVLDWLREQEPLDDFPGDPGEEGLLPPDDVRL